MALSTSFYITVISNDPSNTIHDKTSHFYSSEFKNVFQQQIPLPGKWKVGLIDFSFFYGAIAGDPNPTWESPVNVPIFIYCDVTEPTIVGSQTANIIGKHCLTSENIVARTFVTTSAPIKYYNVGTSTLNKITISFQAVDRNASILPTQPYITESPHTVHDTSASFVTLHFIKVA